MVCEDSLEIFYFSVIEIRNINCNITVVLNVLKHREKYLYSVCQDTISLLKYK